MILNIGFVMCAGVFLFAPVGEREFKTRPVLNLFGMRQLGYWLGLLTGDLLLFVPQAILFVALILCIGLRPFSDQLGEFTALIMMFGLSLITHTYLFSHMFTKQNQATKWLVTIYLLVCTFLPQVLSYSSLVASALEN